MNRKWPTGITLNQKIAELRRRIVDDSLERAKDLRKLIALVREQERSK